MQETSLFFTAPFSQNCMFQAERCFHGSVLILPSSSSCQYKLNTLWTASLRDSPLAATPTFFDVDGDSYGDIVAPSFSGEVWAVHGESGHIVDNWPFYLEERAFHASPLVVSPLIIICLLIFIEITYCGGPLVWGKRKCPLLVRCPYSTA